MIIVVEDDVDISSSLKEILSNNGYSVECASTISEFELLNKQFANEVKLYLLDVKLPDGNGFEVCRRIREKCDVPIIFLTSCDDEDSIITGLNIGADDYVTKPFRINVLLSRINANLRRYDTEIDNIYQKGNLKVYFDKYKIEKDGVELNISTKEFEIIKILIENRGKVIKREILYDRIWDSKGVFVEYNTLTVTVSRIKSKLGTFGANNQQYIETLRNVGYRWIE